MNRIWVCGLSLLAILSGDLAMSSSPVAVPSSAAPAATPPPSTTPPQEANGAVAPLPPAPQRMMVTDWGALWREFVRAQATELRALDHRNRFERKELSSSQEAQRKEWEKKEREARHRFFAEHSRAPERREYVADFLKRRTIFRKQLVDESQRLSKQRDEQLKALKADQARKLKEFKQNIDNKVIPPEDLWPKAH